MAETNEMLETLKDVVRRLDELGIDHMVTGSFAMSLYAPARMTMDIDIVLDISATDADTIEGKFRGDYYVDAVAIRRADANQSMFNMLSNINGVKVDCIIKKQDAFETARFKRRKRSRIGDVEFWAIGRDDLIISKLRWARDSHSELQFRDIRNLIESGADIPALLTSIKRLGLDDTWTAFEKWKTQAAK